MDNLKIPSTHVGPPLKIRLSVSAQKIDTVSYECEKSLVASNSVRTSSYKVKLKNPKSMKGFFDLWGTLKIWH